MLQIVERRMEPCLCAGDPAVELVSESGERLALIGVHHGRTIRFGRSAWDAPLREGRKLLEWLSSHGVPGPLNEVLEDQRRREERQRIAERWFSAMPRSLEPHRELMASMNLNEPARRTLMQALEEEFPAIEGRALALFSWLGSGEGPWQSYPGYEEVPPQLLREIPIADLLRALETSEISPRQLEGASRYFAVGMGRNQASRSREASQMSFETKRRLLKHCFANTCERNRDVARRAFR